MPVYGFADQAEFDRAKAAIRAMEEFLRRSGEPEFKYQSPAVTLEVRSFSELEEEDGPEPSEGGVFLARVIYRDFTVTDPNDPDAWPELTEAGWVEVYGPNLEVLVEGRGYRGRITGASSEEPYRPRAEVTPEGDVWVRPTVAGAGDGTFAAATVQKWNSGTMAWEDTSPAVEVQFRPRWLGMKQKVGPLWAVASTGKVDDTFDPPRIKVEGVIPPRIKRQVQIGCNSSGAPLFANIWTDDVT